ncbi:unnamed protein product, partial [Urochloa humidicola]
EYKIRIYDKHNRKQLGWSYEWQRPARIASNRRRLNLLYLTIDMSPRLARHKNTLWVLRGREMLGA